MVESNENEEAFQGTLLDAIEKTVIASENSKLSDDFFEQGQPFIKFLSEKFGLTPVQTVLFAGFIEASFDGSISCRDLIRFFRCENVTLMRFAKDINALVERHLLKEGIVDADRKTYYVPTEVLEALERDEVYEYVPKEITNVEVLLIEIENRITDIADGRSQFYISGEEVVNLIEGNKQIEFAKKVSDMNYSQVNKFIVMLLCTRLVVDEKPGVSLEYLRRLFPSDLFYSIRASLLSGKSELFTDGIVENAMSDGQALKDCFCLTAKCRKELLGDLAEGKDDELGGSGLVQCSALQEKQLFYNPEEGRQLEKIRAALGIEKFGEVRESLKKSGFRNGLTILFYGTPGTGKTETAYQLARQTGRAIMPVNVTDIMDKWVGESEKHIKAIFDSYRARVAAMEVTPILLFNEADGIMGKRTEAVEHSVDQMSNSIQNIILQEMEKLDGIMIATTNLTVNMDKAFERRFLYKVKFERPGVEARTAIWKTMLPELDESQAAEMAAGYDFSGGQMENIARKLKVDAVLEGKCGVDLSGLREACDAENVELGKKGVLAKRGKRIGF